MLSDKLALFFTDKIEGLPRHIAEGAGREAVLTFIRSWDKLRSIEQKSLSNIVMKDVEDGRRQLRESERASGKVTIDLIWKWLGMMAGAERTGHSPQLITVSSRHCPALFRRSHAAAAPSASQMVPQYAARPQRQRRPQQAQHSRPRNRPSHRRRKRPRP